MDFVVHHAGKIRIEETAYWRVVRMKLVKLVVEETIARMNVLIVVVAQVALEEAPVLALQVQGV